MRDAVIVSTARTPIGRAYRGAFNDTYRIVASTPLKQIAAVRLRVLTHDSLPHQGPGLAGVEEREPHDDGDADADTDLGGEPAQIRQGDRAVQGEAEEVADEQQLPSQKTPRAETP